ncbi:MAG: methyltransferase domain-containing protein [Aureispira sp.]
MRELVGNIDIYLLDQILKGRYEQSQRILDAGCGTGRNLLYFLKQGMEVYGIDPNEERLGALKTWCQEQFPTYPLERFQIQLIENMTFEAASFDVIISNAVLHFAQNKAHFERLLQAMWQILKREGHLFVRLASSIGIEDKVVALGEGQFLLPDGSVRFLVTESDLLHYTQQLGGTLTEYIKTTNVQGLRCMTTWCLQKQ